LSSKDFKGSDGIRYVCKVYCQSVLGQYWYYSTEYLAIVRETSDCIMHTKVPSILQVPELCKRALSSLLDRIGIFVYFIHQSEIAALVCA
jgi:hypothetical protein